MRASVKTILIQGNETAFSPVARIQVLGLYQTMTVILTAEQEKFIAEQVGSGHFKSAADVIAQGLGMLRAQEEFIRTNMAELREQITTGWEQIQRGETVDGTTALQNLRQKLHERERGGQ